MQYGLYSQLLLMLPLSHQCRRQVRQVLSWNQFDPGSGQTPIGELKFVTASHQRHIDKPLMTTFDRNARRLQVLLDNVGGVSIQRRPRTDSQKRVLTHRTKIALFREADGF